MDKTKTVRHFKKYNGFFKLFWIFIFFSVLGIFSEGIFWIFRYGHFDFRPGLIYGPFSEIYGFAAVLLILLLNKFKDRSWLFLFVASYIISVSFELFCSFIQESAFGFTSWDYSTSKLTILGRAHLIYAIPWGLCGLILIKKIYPKFSDIIDSIPNRAGTVISWLMLLFMIFDFTVSAAAVYRFDQRQNNIPATNIIQTELDHYYPDARLKETFARIAKGRT